MKCLKGFEGVHRAEDCPGLQEKLDNDITFTDDDLKVMQKFAKSDIPFNRKLQALLERLDAAENCLMHLRNIPEAKYNPIRRDLMEWRKRAGK